MRIYDVEKLWIKTEVQSALTVDLWTSSNYLAIIEMIAYYITKAGQLDYSVLALQELDREHSG
jgi:hypothetical protein